MERFGQNPLQGRWDRLGRQPTDKGAADPLQSRRGLRARGQLPSNQKRSLDSMDSQLVAQSAGNLRDSLVREGARGSGAPAGFGILCSQRRNHESLKQLFALSKSDDRTAGEERN